MKKTQKDLVYERLLRGPLCSEAFWHEDKITHRVAARIHDLRRELGHDAIESRPCQVAWHSHSSPAVEYRLVDVPEGQQVLL